MGFLPDVLKMCTPTMNPHEMHESEYLHGITLHGRPNDGGLVAYSSDSRTMTRVSGPWYGPERRVLLSSRLVKDIIGSPYPLDAIVAGRGGQHALAIYDAGTTTFAKSAVAAAPEKYEAVAESVDWGKKHFDPVDVKDLLMALDLIDMVVQGEEHRVCEIEATGTRLVLKGKGWSSGSIKGEASCAFKTKHKSKSSVNPADLRTGLAHATHISLHQDRAIAMCAGGDTYRYMAARTQPRT